MYGIRKRSQKFAAVFSSCWNGCTKLITPWFGVENYTSSWETPQILYADFPQALPRTDTVIRDKTSQSARTLK
jgi:hypothetical protein